MEYTGVWCVFVCLCDKLTTRISILKFELLKIYRQHFIGSIQTMRSLLYLALWIDTQTMNILRLRPLCIPVICLFFDDFHNTHAWSWYYFWKETHTHYNFNKSKSKRMSTWICLIKYFPIPYMYQCTIFHCICGNRIDTSTKAAF